MYLIYEKDNLGRTVFELIFKNTGSVYAKDGVANFTAYMLNKRGSLKEKEDFFSKLEEKAVNLNISVNREFTTFSMAFLNSKSNFAIKKLIELLTEPNFSEEAFLKTKNELLAKKENLKNNYDYIASKNLFKVLFKNTPLEYPIIGENIENITLEDVKKHFQNYSKNNLVIINGGKKLDISAFLEILPQKDVLKNLYFRAKEGKITEKQKVEQSYIYFGSNYEIKKDYLYLAKIATFILGAGGFGSRVMEEIRVKKGYAYSAYVQNDFHKTYSIIKGYMQTKLENTDDAIDTIEKIFDEFYTKGITQEELNQAKQFLIGSEPLRNEILAQRLLRKFREYYFNLGEGYYEKELKLIEKTSLLEINEFIKNNRPQKLSYSIVTNDKNN